MVKNSYKDYLTKSSAQAHNISKLKNESRERRNMNNLMIDPPVNQMHHENTILSKSVDSNSNEKAVIQRFKGNNESLHNDNIIRINIHHDPSDKMKDSPYTSSYTSKGRRKNHENNTSKDSLRRSTKYKDDKGINF